MLNTVSSAPVLSNHRKPQVPNKLQMGLANLGNTCFMNSSLQLLLHIYPLVNYFLSEQYARDLNTKSPTKGEVAASFQQLIQDITASDCANVSPVKLRKAVGHFAPYLMDYSQQDCQEFLRFILDGLGEDLKRRKELPHAATLAAASGPEDGARAEAEDAPRSVKKSTPSPAPPSCNMGTAAVGAVGGLSPSPKKMSAVERLRLKTREADEATHAPTSTAAFAGARVGDGCGGGGNNNDDEIDDEAEVSMRRARGAGTGTQPPAAGVPECTVPQGVDLTALAVGEVPTPPLSEPGTPGVEAGPVGDPATACGSGGGGGSPAEKAASPGPSVAVPSDPAVGPSSSCSESGDNFEQANKAWAQYQERNSSVITDIFAGQLQSTVECMVCHHKSFTFDPFLDLSVPIPSTDQGQAASATGAFITPWRLRSGNSTAAQRQKAAAEDQPVAQCSLEDCLAKFTGVEILEGDNAYLCEKCNVRQRCSKRLAIVRYPRVLVVHINRFRYTTTVREKIPTDVKFPAKAFDLSPFLAVQEGNKGSAGSAVAAPLGATAVATGADPATLVADVSTQRGKLSADNALVASVEDAVACKLRRSSAGTQLDQHAPAALYDLVGISHHCGSMHGGHYIAHIDVNNGSNVTSDGAGGVVGAATVESAVAVAGAGAGAGAGATSKWMCFNDARVSSINSNAIGGPSAYVLFYTLRDSSSL